MFFIWENILETDELLTGDYIARPITFLMLTWRTHTIFV